MQHPSTKPITRDEWRRQQDACHNPGCKASLRSGDIMDVHEIIGGPIRSKTITMPETWIFLCRRCHEHETSCPSQDRLVRLLTVKQWADPEHSNPSAVIRLWRPKCTKEFLAEMLNAVAKEYAKIVKELQ